MGESVCERVRGCDFGPTTFFRLFSRLVSHTHSHAACRSRIQVTVQSEELTFLHDTINMLVEDVGLDDDGKGVGSKNVEHLLDQLDAKMR